MVVPLPEVLFHAVDVGSTYVSMRAFVCGSCLLDRLGRWSGGSSVRSWQQDYRHDNGMGGCAPLREATRNDVRIPLIPTWVFS